MHTRKNRAMKIIASCILLTGAISCSPDINSQTLDAQDEDGTFTFIGWTDAQNAPADAASSMWQGDVNCNGDELVCRMDARRQEQTAPSPIMAVITFKNGTAKADATISTPVASYQACLTAAQKKASAQGDSNVDCKTTKDGLETVYRTRCSFGSTCQNGVLRTGALHAAALG